MKIYAKRRSDVFCPGQTFILAVKIMMLLHNELNHSDVRGAHQLMAPKIREFEYLETSIQSLENEIQIEK